MMTYDEMIKCVDAVEEFNREQLETEPIHEMFCKVDQDPWKDCRAKFTADFDKLDKYSMQKTKPYPTTVGVDEI